MENSKNNKSLASAGNISEQRESELKRRFNFDENSSPRILEMLNSTLTNNISITKGTISNLKKENYSQEDIEFQKNRLKDFEDTKKIVTNIIDWKKQTGE